MFRRWRVERAEELGVLTIEALEIVMEQSQASRRLRHSLMPGIGRRL
jgi:hypothetical protein